MIIESLIKHKVSIFSEIPSEVQIQNNYLFWVHNELFNYLKNSLRLKAKEIIVGILLENSLILNIKKIKKGILLKLM